MEQVFITIFRHIILHHNVNFNLGKTVSQVSMDHITIQQVDLDILQMQPIPAHLEYILAFIPFFIIIKL